LRKPIGIQDQYIAAHGGQRFMSFGIDGKVVLESAALDNGGGCRLNQNLMLFFTNVTRRAETVLAEQQETMNAKIDILREMKKLAFTAKECLLVGSYDEFGLLLHEGWRLKKQLATQISNEAIDEVYSRARKAGALGGKITGAGGGGFLLLYCPRSRQEDVRAALRNLPELTFGFERAGTKVIFDYSR
jgi:D-glycero-alpha-D-manno-heptose-7-phosphate kinase